MFQASWGWDTTSPGWRGVVHTPTRLVTGHPHSQLHRRLVKNFLNAKMKEQHGSGGRVVAGDSSQLPVAGSRLGLTGRVPGTGHNRIQAAGTRRQRRQQQQRHQVPQQLSFHSRGRSVLAGGGGPAVETFNLLEFGAMCASLLAVRPGEVLRGGALSPVFLCKCQDWLARGGAPVCGTIQPNQD